MQVIPMVLKTGLGGPNFFYNGADYKDNIEINSTEAQLANLVSKSLERQNELVIIQPHCM